MQELDAVITAKITIGKDKKDAFLVRLLNHSTVGEGKSKTNSLIFLKEIWSDDIEPVIGQIITLSEIIVAGRKKGKYLFRAKKAFSKPVNVKD